MTTAKHGAAGATSPSAEGRELVIRRTFDAPRALVWKAWTERERARQWWGPKGFTTPVLEMDVRPGGAWRAVMRSPEGEEYPQHGVLLEMVPPERLVFTVIWDSAPDDEHLVTITLVEKDGKTDMTFRKGPFTSASSQKGEMDGWNQAFDRLQAYVAKR